MRLNKLTGLVTAVCVLALGAGVAIADTICVPDDYPTIQEAIDAALAGDEVIVAPGTYNEAIDFLSKAITVRSSIGPYVTTIDASGRSDSTVTARGVSTGTTFDGFTVTGGHGDPGGGLDIQGDPTIRRCVITGNYGSKQGGGIYCRGPATIIDCVITGNRADDGGGIYCIGATIIDCVIAENEARKTPQPSGGRGGGVACYEGARLLNCTILSNVSRSNGCISSGYGGGVAGDGLLVNCVVALNVEESCDDAIGAGGVGGIGPFGPLQLVNCAIVGNIVAHPEGGVGDPVGFGVFQAELINCIVWANIPDQIDESQVSYSCVQDGWSGTGNIETDPRFVDPSDGDYRLSPASPCIDAGDNLSVPSDVLDLDGDGDTTEPIPFDIRGLPRFVDDPGTPDTGFGDPPIVDMGAYEYQVGCAADIDGSGDVGFADLLAVLSNWGPCPGCTEDLDDDGDVGFTDLLIVLSDWGPCEDQPGVGACCLPEFACSTATCITVSPNTCSAAGGAYQGDGTECGRTGCPEPGACCFGSFSCDVQLEAQCVSAGGSFVGEGVICGSTDCTRGACCLPDGTCFTIDPATCEVLAGTYQGDGTTCETVSCP